MTRFRLGVLATHPIQYYVPWYRALAQVLDLEVFYSHRQTTEGQADAGFSVEFEWDIPMLEGYSHTFLRNVARRPDVNRFFGCDTPELADLIRDRRFDAFIVHGWATKSYWQAIRACWSTRTPVLVRGDSTLSTPRAGWRRAMKYPLHRCFVPRFDGYLTVGTRAKTYLTHYGASPEKCFDAPHAVDNDRFRASAAALRGERAKLRESFGMPASAVAFLFVGKFIDLKRPMLFVDAVAEAVKQNVEVAGLMVGDGPLRPATEARARALRAPVSFAGFLNQGAISRAYAAADVLVVPSAHETWGLVVNEAMASGLPAIVTEGVGCSDDLVIPDETGARFPVDDRAALARHLVALSDRRRLQQLATGAARRIETFSVSAAVAGTVRALEFVTRGRVRPDPSASSVVSLKGAGR